MCFSAEATSVAWGSVPPQSMSVDQPSGIVKLMSPLLRVPGDCGEVDSWGRNSHGAVGASIWVTSGSGSEDSSSPSGTYSPPAGSRSGASDCGVCSEPARGSSEGRKTVRVSTSATTTSSTAAALRPPTTSMVAMLRGGSPPGPLPRPAPGGPPDGPRGSPGPPPGPGPPALADPLRGSRPAPESPWKSGSRGPPGGCPEPPLFGCCVTSVSPDRLRVQDSAAPLPPAGEQKGARAPRGSLSLRSGEATITALRP